MSCHSIDMRDPAFDRCPTSLSLTLSALHVYANVFDGDVEAWLEYLRAHGSEQQRRGDLPIAWRLRSALAKEPTLRQRILRSIIELQELGNLLEESH